MDFQLKRFISLLLFLFPIILFGCDGSSGSNSSLTNFYLDENNVTIRCENADVNDSDTVNGIIYTKISARTDLVMYGGSVDATQACTSGITDMSSWFMHTETFNKDIGQWDTSSVLSMSDMFNGAEAFNQDIGPWNTGDVTNMQNMFLLAKSFNRDIGQWATGYVTTMESMFQDASSFNQGLEDWDTDSVTNMSSMFYGASSFNQELQDWCVNDISEKPTNFDTDSSFENNTAIQPQWGTCPLEIVLYNDMDENEQLLFSHEMGFSDIDLSQITEDDLYLCNNLEYAKPELDLTELCEGDEILESNIPDWTKFDYVNWMSTLPGTRKLNEVIMPGSHDAGISRCDDSSATYTTTRQQRLTQTQYFNILTQLRAGTRYFDIRIEDRGGVLMTYHRSEKLGSDVGCSGEKLHEVLEAIRMFLSEGKNETVIVDLSHFRTLKALQRTIYYLEGSLGNYRGIYYTTSDTFVNIAELPLSKLRGKLILLLDDSRIVANSGGYASTQGRHYFHDPEISSKEVNEGITKDVTAYAIHVKYPTGVATLSIYDKYSATQELGPMVIDQDIKRIKVAGLGQPYLSLLSWTRTLGANISIDILSGISTLSIKEIAEEANSRLPLYLSSLWASSQNLPNIVFYDYITAFTNYWIIQNNYFDTPLLPIADRYVVSGTNTYIYAVDQTKVFRSPGIQINKDNKYFTRSIFTTGVPVPVSRDATSLTYPFINWIGYDTKYQKSYYSQWDASTKADGTWPSIPNGEVLKLSTFKFNENMFWMESKDYSPKVFVKLPTQ